MCFFQHLALLIQHLHNSHRLHMDAVVSEGAISTGHLQRSHALGHATDGDSIIHIIGTALLDEGADAHLLCQVDDFFHAHFLGNLNGRHIQGLLRHIAHSHSAVKVAAIVLRLPAPDIDRLVLYS